MEKIFNPYLIGLKCPLCNKLKDVDLYKITCTSCKTFLEPVYDYEKLKDVVQLVYRFKSRIGVWRYRYLLPLALNHEPISLGEGGTPLLRARDSPSGIHLFIKNESLNPTGSFLDRGSTVLVSILEKFTNHVSCANNANLAASLAAYSARVNMKVIFFGTRLIDRGELYQAMALGAEVRIFESQEEAQRAAIRTKAYYVDSGNPFLLEGEKTTAFEIAESLGWKAPDWIIVPVGTGGHLSMIWKGFCELKKLGLLRSSLPHLVGVQSEAWSPLVNLFDGKIQLAPNKTLATDIVFLNPPKIREAFHAIRESRGLAVRVSDEEIICSIKHLASKEGILAEPAAASSYAALLKLVEGGYVDKGEVVTVIITGSGLKDPETIQSLIGAKTRSLSIYGTKLQLLKLIAYKGKFHGYSLWKLLASKGISLSLPTIYHHLKEMERMGLIRRITSWKGRRVTYEITDEGLKLLASSK